VGSGLPTTYSVPSQVRATARDALCRGFDPCRQRPRGVVVDFGPKQSGWLINQLGAPQFTQEHICRLVPAVDRNDTGP
jgi:hypothetical protein